MKKTIPKQFFVFGAILVLLNLVVLVRAGIHSNTDMVTGFLSGAFVVGFFLLLYITKLLNTIKELYERRSRGRFS